LDVDHDERQEGEPGNGASATGTSSHIDLKEAVEDFGSPGARTRSPAEAGPVFREPSVNVTDVTH
jgi:hypothetical protein